MELILRRYSWALYALVVGLGAYLVASTVNIFATAAIAPGPALPPPSAAPQAAGDSHRMDLAAERIARLFDVPLPKGPARADPDEEPRGPGVWNWIPIRSSLHGTLIGTAIADPPRYSLCQITNPDLNDTQVYGIGDKYQAALIYRIERERVLLDHDGVNEYIDGAAAGVSPFQGSPGTKHEGGDGIRQLTPTQYVVARSELNNALTNLPDLATKARIVPSFKNGVADGFKFFSIVPDSLYAKIGIQNGDVIRRINGYEMNTPDKALEIYQKLRDASRIEIEIERRGDVLRKSYSIE